MSNARSGLLEPGPDALLQAARSLEMNRLALLLSCLQEPRASLFRVVLQALTVLWCWLWMDGWTATRAGQRCGEGVARVHCAAFRFRGMGGVGESVQGPRCGMARRGGPASEPDDGHRAGRCGLHSSDDA